MANSETLNKTMSSKIILYAAKGTVGYQEGNHSDTYRELPAKTCADLDQEESKRWKVILTGSVTCELHRRKAVPSGHCTAEKPKESLCLKVSAKNGAFQSIKVITRPRQRKLGNETEEALHDRKRELKWKRRRTFLEYSVKNFHVEIHAIREAGVGVK